MTEEKKNVVFLSVSDAVFEVPLKAYFSSLGFEGHLVQDMEGLNAATGDHSCFLVIRDESVDVSQEQIRGLQKNAKFDLLLASARSAQAFPSLTSVGDSILFTSNRYLTSLLLRFKLMGFFYDLPFEAPNTMGWGYFYRECQPQSFDGLLSFSNVIHRYLMSQKNSEELEKNLSKAFVFIRELSHCVGIESYAVMSDGVSFGYSVRLSCKRDLSELEISRTLLCIQNAQYAFANVQVRSSSTFEVAIFEWQVSGERKFEDGDLAVSGLSLLKGKEGH